MLPEERSKNACAHSSHAHRSAHPAREEDAERQRQKDTAAPQRHGEIIPLQHRRIKVHKDKHHRSDRNGQNAQAACPQLACSRSLKPDFADDITRNHRTYAQRQACNRTQGRKQHGAQANTSEPLRQIGNEIQRQCVNRIYLRMMQMHEHTDHY